MNAITALASVSCPTVRLAEVGPRYTARDILAALPLAAHVPVPSLGASKVPPAGDTQLIEEAAAFLADKVPDLWQGRWAALFAPSGQKRFASQSEADFALAAMIAEHLGGQGISNSLLADLVEATFGRSVLATRVKWQQRPDYRRETVRKACERARAALNARAKTTKVDWSAQGDLRTAKLFADMWRGNLLYVWGENRWLVWENERWRPCNAGQQMQRAKETCRALFAAAGDELSKNLDGAGRLVNEAVRAHYASRIAAMLDLGRSEAGMSILPEKLDSDSHLLGVENGVVALRSGQLLVNEPALLITQHCAAEYDPTASCPRWLSFLDEVFEGDQATIMTVQRLLGYTLTGLNTEEVIVFCVGFGANGKSIFGNVVSTILGDYAKMAPSSLLAARRADDHAARGDLAMLNGARLVSVNELPAGLTLNEQVVKQLAGREPITARHLYGEFFTYSPRFTPWVRTNHKPIIKGDDDGIWRRLIILSFGRRFAENERDPRLEGKLLAERNGILAWMVKGAQVYLRDGLALSRAVETQRAQYRRESDLLGEFLEECALSRPAERVEQSALYASWGYWCDQNGTQPGSKKSFTQRLAERGHAASKSNGARYYQGLNLPPPFGTGRGGRV